MCLTMVWALGLTVCWALGIIELKICILSVTIIDQCSTSVPLQTSKYLWFSDVFRGYKSEALVENRLNLTLQLFLYFFLLSQKIALKYRMCSYDIFEKLPSSM